jgi:Zn-dependent protease
LRIKIHYTWIAALALVTTIVAMQFAENYSLVQRIILGMVVSVLFLITLAMREFTLSLAAFQKEMRGRKITLFAFGGMDLENRDNMVPAHLPLLYIARFLSNLAIAAIFYGLYATFVNANNSSVASIAQWLAYIFFFLFLLHFIPVFPLDGGAILRIILWKLTGDYYKATRIASSIGWAAGFFLIFGGVLYFIITRYLTLSLLMVGLGWIIQLAAGYTRRQVMIHTVLQNIEAQDVMVRDYPSISGQVNIRRLIREHILLQGWQYAVATDGGKPIGILTLKQIKKVPPKLWNSVTTVDIAARYARAGMASPQQTADTLYEEMNLRNTDYMPVMEGDKIAGVVTRSALMNLVRNRSEFGV